MKEVLFETAVRTRTDVRMRRCREAARVLKIRELIRRFFSWGPGRYADASPAARLFQTDAVHLTTMSRILIDKIKEADGHRGPPVYYAGPNGILAQPWTVSFMLPAVRSGLNRQPQS